MVNFIWNGEKSLEIRALDPITDGFTFRVADKSLSLFQIRPETVTFKIFSFPTRSYKAFTAKDFKITELKERHSLELNASTFSFECNEPAFKQLFTSMLKEYENYIKLKLNMDELDVMDVLNDRKLSEDFPKDLEAFKASVTRQLPATPYKLEPVELALNLDTFDFMKAFLSMKLNDFEAYYWSKNALSSHPVVNTPVTHIYIGNQYCPLIFPNEEMLKGLLEKVMNAGLRPVIVFSTMPEHLIDCYKQRLAQINAFCIKNKVTIEVVVNDYGLCSLIKKENLKGFTLTQGTLLTKRKKDPRLSIQPAETSTSSDAPFFRDFLKENFGITAFSQEVCGYPFKMCGRNNILHLPMYQTNTSGHCTLYAICKNGDRARQTPVLSCPHYCESLSLLYPGDSKIVGRFNSLFGVSMTELNDSKVLNEIIKNNVKRLVVRL